ncbi:enoyl-CoA hydratase/isomerase family protein [Halococcus agarilyticus]|uniref:enoyl-CoA hydratase/isomerase family protein n=1 Tax=Halococcus agarilyticus TaxID=1232219 RepID=UPI000678194A|nr:enoyl-CoA hydratase/isomerase family protein [Halococcus agarilyticus]
MIDIETRDRIAWITLDRPDVLNAFTAEGWHDLVETVEHAEEVARVAVLRGSGDAFCVGEDVEWLSSLTGPEDVAEFADTVYAGFRAIETASIPVVAAVDGPAYGAGFDLVAATDLAVATTESRFALPETRLGAYPGYAIERIPSLCTRKRFLELVLTGEPIEAETAREWGLINRVVDPTELESAVAELVESVLESPRRPVGIVTRLVGNRLRNEAEQERMMGLFTSLFLADEFEEGVDAFAAGRDPEW